MNPPILVGYSPQTADRGPINFGVAVSRFTGAPLVVAAVFPGGSDIDRLSGGEFGGDAGGDKSGLEQLQSELESSESTQASRWSSTARPPAGWPARSRKRIRAWW